MRRLGAIAVLAAALALSPWTARADLAPDLVARMADGHKLDADRRATLARVLARLPHATQGIAGPSRHPVTRERCRAEVLDAGLLPDPPAARAACAAPHMAPLGPTGACIDRYEFPGLPCEYPVTWVTPVQAADLCQAIGKRLCDAHEWEGACAGDPGPPDYRFDLGQGPARDLHNRLRVVTWTYGATRRGDLCAFGAGKSPGCDRAISTIGGDVRRACGQNTWPAGWHHQCAGPLGVHDLHGNVAEHMSLPGRPAEIGGGRGWTEMKGSWFAFPRTAQATVHPDDCRWRAPAWHRTRVEDPRGHANYHLGFRCCKSVGR
jgi:hypothetical protein